MSDAVAKLCEILCHIQVSVSNEACSVLESFQHTSFSDQSTPPFDVLKNLAAKVFVPAAVEQKAKLVHLQQVAWRRFVVRARERRELDDGRHPLHWNWNQYGTKGLVPT